MPSLKEKKRYIVYEVISEKQMPENEVRNSIQDSATRYIGEKGMALAGMQFIKNAGSKGMIRVANKQTVDIKASFCFIYDINGNQCIVRSLGTSGILKKAMRWMV